MPQHYVKVLLFCISLLTISHAGAQVDCNAPTSNTPYLIKIDTKLTQAPNYCYSTGKIVFSVGVVGGGAANASQWQFRMDDGAWQSSATFNNVPPGSYNFSARNSVTGCVTEFSGNPVSFWHKFPGGEPIINDIVTTDASFCSDNGTITIYAENSGGLNFRINGGEWTDNNTFSNLAEGTYTIEVSNGSCITTDQAIIAKLARPQINSINTVPSTNCSSPNGQITIVASSPYDLVYSIDDGENWSLNNVFTSLSPGSYDVAVSIAGEEGCKVRRLATVGGSSSVAISSVTSTAATSCSAMDGKITINATGSSTLYYRVEGGAWQSSKTITGLAPGSYNVFVKNSNGSCEIAYINNPVVVGGVGAIVINSVNTVAPTTCDTLNANGQITINATGGSGLKYSINGGTSFTTNNIFSNLRSGTYNIVVTKSDGSCPVNYAPVGVPSPSPITVQSVQTVRPSICGASNGSITITAAPVGTYQYSINGGQSFQASNTFSNLSQGSYQIVVKSGDNCTAFYSSNPVSLQALTCPEICNDGIDNDGNGQIDDCADPSCGLEPIQMQITQPSCPNATPTGSIAINTVIQSKDCSNLAPGDIVITNTSAFITGSFKFAPKVTILGGTQIIFTDKEWTGGGFSSSEGLVQWTAPSGGLAAGTLVTISKSFTIWTASHGTALGDESIPNYQNYDSSNPDFRFDSNYGDNLIALCGNSFAAGEISQIKFLFSLDFDVFTSTTPPGLVAGVTAITSPGQYGATYPAPVIDTIKYSINGGQTWQTNSTFSNLSPGFYKVLVKFGNCITAYSNNPIQIFACQEICDDGIDNDGNGLADCNDPACGVAAYTFEVTQPGCPPQATTGDITILPSNSTNNLYSIDNGSSWHGMPTFHSLADGNYQILVKRTDTECELAYPNGNIILEQPTCYEICDDGVDNDSDGDVDCEDSDCGVTADFELDVTAPTCPTGSDNGVISISNVSPPVFKDCSNLQAGDIAITFYDADPDRFIFVPRVNIAEGTKIIFTDKGYETTPPQMRSAEGIAQWTAPTGGVLAGTEITIVRSPLSATVGTVAFDTAIPGYTAFDSSSPSFSLSTSGDQLIALCGASLNVNQVTFLFAIHANGNNWDSDSNSDGASAIPPGLIDGVTAIAVGDVAEATIPLAPIPPPVTYAYSIDGGQSFDASGIFSNLVAGDYEILIQNQNSGCVIAYSESPILLESPECPEICDDGIDNDGDGLIDCADSDCGVPSFAVATIQPNCPPNPINGTITITPYGAATYQYSVDNGINWQDSTVFANREPGEYQIMARKVESGCTLAYAGNPVALQSPFCEEICGDGIDNDLDDLIDCEDEDCNIPRIEDFNSTPPTYCYSTNGSITVNAVPLSGESSDPSEWEYSKDDGVTWQSSNVFTGLAPGTYYLKVRNAVNSCDDDSPAQIATLEPSQTDNTPSVILEPINPSFCTGNDGRIILNVFDGEAPYQYRLNGGSWVSTNEFDNLSQGAYTIEVSSNNGACVNTLTQTLTQLSEIIISDVTTNSDCSDNSNEIHIATTPNTGLQYSINDGISWNSSPDFTDLAADTYQVAVRYNNDNRCVVHHTESIAFEEFVPITITHVTATATTQCDLDDGSITISATGNRPLEYRIESGEWQASNVFSNLTSGSYNVYIRYAEFIDVACEVAYSGNPVQINAPAFPVIVPIDYQNPTACSTNDGTITITMSESGNYLYSINEGQDFVATTNFSSLPIGSYQIIVKNQDTNCSTAYSNNPIELTALPQTEICDDGIDNDCDGLTDCEDDDCEDNPACIVGPAGKDTTTCPGLCVLLGKEDNDPALCYAWKAADDSGDYFYGTTPGVCPTETTTYILHITNDQGDIVEIDEITVTVPFALTFSPEYPSVCPGSPVTIEAIPSGGTNYTFLWETGETTPAITVTPETISFYSVEVTDTETGCKINGEAQVNTIYPPNISILSSYPSICQQAPVELKQGGAIQKNLNQNEECPGSTLLYAGTGLTGYTYQWSNGGTEPLITVDLPGTYTVTVTKVGGCSSVATYELGSCVQPSIEPQVVTIDGQEQQVLDAGEYASYLWSDGSTNRTIPLIGAGTYAVTVVDESGCMGSNQFSINEYNVDPSDVYLVFNVVDPKNEQHDVYICSSLAPEGELRDKIQTIIQKELPKVDADPPYPINFIWTCSPMHTDIHSIIKGANSNLRLYPMIIKDFGDGLGIRRGTQYTWLNPITQKYEFPYYDFRLDIDGAIFDINLESEDYFNINFNSLADIITANLFLANNDGNYLQAPNLSMNIEFFKSVSEPTEISYILYYNGAPAPDVIEVEEFTDLNFSIKEKGTPPAGDKEVDLNKIQSITWKRNNSIILRANQDYKITDNLPTDQKDVAIQYTTPASSIQGIEIPFGVSVNVGPNLKTVIKLKPINPGYKVVPPASDIAACKGGNPLDYVENARMAIQNSTEFSAMYSELINNRRINIIILSSSDPRYKPDTPGGKLFGWTDYQPEERDKRVFIDPLLETVTYGPGKYAKCPTNARLLVKISSEEYLLLRRAIDNGLPFNQDGQDVLIIANRIAEPYPDYVANTLIQLLSVSSQSEKDAAKAQLETHFINRKLAYYGTPEELDMLIQLPDKGDIYLTADLLCDITLHAKRVCSTGVYSATPDAERIRSWYAGLSDRDISTSPNHQVHKIRKSAYNNTLTHEMAHILYKLQHKVEAYKWRLLTNSFNIFNSDTCYPGRPTTTDDYCSQGGGHEYSNPDGLDACNAGEKFEFTDCVRISN